MTAEDIKKTINTAMREKGKTAPEFSYGMPPHGPDMQGIFQIHGGWFVYSTDEHGRLDMTGPFTDDNDIIRACAKQMNISGHFMRYSPSSKAKYIYAHCHFKSVKKAEEYMVVHSGIISSTRDAWHAMKKSILGGIKVPHITSYPVIRREDGTYRLAVFVIFYTRHDILSGYAHRPSVWAEAKIENGMGLKEYQAKDREFASLSYDMLYRIYTDEKPPEGHMEKAFALLDKVRAQIIVSGTFPEKKYRQYMDMVLKYIPDDQKPFYVGLSI